MHTTTNIKAIEKALKAEGKSHVKDGFIYSNRDEPFPTPYNLVDLAKKAREDYNKEKKNIDKKQFSRYQQNSNPNNNQQFNQIYQQPQQNQIQYQQQQITYARPQTSDEIHQIRHKQNKITLI